MPPTLAAALGAPLSQHSPTSCGAAVGARILSTRASAPATSEATLEDKLFLLVNELYPRRDPTKAPNPALPDTDYKDNYFPNEPQPPAGSNGGFWGCAPAELAQALSTQIPTANGAPRYKVCSKLAAKFNTAQSRNKARKAMLSKMVGSIDAGWPTPVLIHRGAHWVLAYRVVIGGTTPATTYADISVISPQYAVPSAAAVIVDLQSKLYDPDWFLWPIDGGTVLPHCFVALVDTGAPQIPLPPETLTALADGAAPPISAVQVQRGAAVPAAIKRFGKSDPGWLPLVGAALGTPVRIERMTAGARPLDLVPIHSAEPGMWSAVVLFDAITGRVTEGARFEAPQRLHYDPSRRLAWGLVLESVNSWLPFYEKDGGFIRADGSEFRKLTPLGPGW